MTSARERLLQSKLYKAVLWITFFSMGGGTLLFTPNLFKKFSTRPGLARVNDIDIPEKEFQAQVAHEYERIALLHQQLGEYADVLLKQWGFDDPRQLALNELIQRALLNQVADKINIHLAPAFLMQKLQDPRYIVNNLRSIVPISVLEQNGMINFTALRSHLGRNGLTMADFEQAIEHALRRNIVMNLIESTAYVSQNDIKNYFVENYVPKKYTIFTFPLEKYLKDVKAQQISDDTLKEFFKQENAKTKRYWIPEKRSAQIWQFKPQQYGVTVADSEIEHFYQQHKQQYLDKPAAIQIRRILFKLPENMADARTVEEKARTVLQEAKDNPGQFEQLARTYSDDAQSAAKGGLIDFFSRGQKDPAIERAAFRLQEDNAISDLFMSQAGIELIQRVSRKSATYKPLTTVRSEIEKKLLKQKFSEKFSSEIQSMLDQTEQLPTVLNEFANKKQAQKSTIDRKELDDTALMKKIFKTAHGQWSYLVDDGNGIIINTSVIERKHEPAFDAVKQRVLQDYYQELAQKQLTEILTKAHTTGTQDNKVLADTFGVKSETTDWLTKIDKEKWQELEKKGVPVAELFALTTKNRIGTAQHEKQGYLLKLTASKEYTAEDLQAHQQEIKQALYQEQEELIKRGYIASLYRNATIKSIKDSEFPQESELPLEEPL